ncbi:MAG: cell division protein FtsA [Candidatus Paceibacterota bacterium]
MSRHIVTGLDIGTATIRVAVCEYKKGSNLPRVLALVKKNSRGLKRGYIWQFDEVVETIKTAVAEAERQSGLRLKRVFTSIGGISLESRVAYGQVAPSRIDSEITVFDIDRAIDASEAALPENKNKSIIHRIPLGFKLDGRKVLGRAEGLKGTKLEARTLFILYSTQHLNDLMNAIESAGLQVEDVLAAPLAASFSTLTKLQKTSGCILANIGAQTTTTVVFEESIPISLQIFPIGSTDITNDIAIGLQVDIGDAEAIKIGHKSADVPRRKLEEIIEARLSDIFELIDNHLKKLGFGGLLPAGIIISGGGAKVENIDNLAKKYLKLPARTADEAIIGSSRNQIKDAVWAIAYGLCLFGADAEAEESLGLRVVRKTKLQFMRWLKELLP